MAVLRIASSSTSIYRPAELAILRVIHGEFTALGRLVEPRRKTLLGKN
jgi:hypothetical protein